MTPHPVSLVRSAAIGALAVVVVAALLASAGLFAAGVQSPADTAQDLGPTAASQVLSASIVLKITHPELLEAYVASTQDPRSPLFHRFLTVPQFVRLYAPSSQEITAITNYLAQFGIQVTDVYADHLLLRVQGTAEAFDKAFSLDVHEYSRHGRRFHRPRHSPRVPAFLSDLLVTIVGPSSDAHFRPMHMRAASSSLPFAHKTPAVTTGTIATGVPGDYTVGDLANMYNINPVYEAGVDGTGRTIGIATLAGFHQEDAFTYWNMIGLSVDPNRLTQVHVDGGGEISADAGSGETSLDVEQSGGVAPGAKMIVYDAPNASDSFMDLFYRAASDNLVDSLSVSWGASEVYYFPQLNGGEDFTPQLIAFHQAFLESAAQGISLFASSGDNGAYDINTGFNTPFNNVLSVGAPSSDPAITAAGGTTTPVTLTLVGNTTAPPLIVNHEQVWGWDYIQDYLVKYVDKSFQNALFPVGTGGGVSVFWPQPLYQDGTPGIRRSEPKQKVIFDDGSVVQTLMTLPAHYSGRNLPDVSLNADPFSGYIVISTEDGGFIDGYGGTSFVAPQLNGISALLSQVANGRMGLWNPMLYRFKQTFGPHTPSPLVDVVGGDNWFYTGVPGYEPGAGLGVLNVAKLAAAVASED